MPLGHRLELLSSRGGRGHRRGLRWLTQLEPVFQQEKPGGLPPKTAVPSHRAEDSSQTSVEGIGVDLDAGPLFFDLFGLLVDLLAAHG